MSVERQLEYMFPLPFPALAVVHTVGSGRRSKASLTIGVHTIVGLQFVPWLFRVAEISSLLGRWISARPSSIVTTVCPRVSSSNTSATQY